ncbi:MAG: metallophosphoesterase [Tatlockia sp.]|nr:metallophosphoesterase [Tatlockia sp.]
MRIINLSILIKIIGYFREFYQFGVKCLLCREGATMKHFLIGLIFVSMFFTMTSGIAAQTDKHNFLVISDIHLDVASNHTMEISPTTHYYGNDLDNHSFEKLIKQIEQNIKTGLVAPPDFIVILGDISGHFRWSSTSVFDNEQAVFKRLKNTFPNTPIFYTFGNNDSLKENYGSFYDTNRSGEVKSPYDLAKFSAGWLDGFLSTGTLCKDNKNSYPCIINEDIISGFYSAYLKSKFRFISLNSVMFSPARKGTTEQDALDQINWLGEELKTAELNQESVLIAMHVPPGFNIYNHANFWLPKEQDLFLKLIKKYQSSIVGMLASHTHGEELKIIKDEAQKNIAGIYFVSALSTSHGNEPSVKTFSFFKENDLWVLANYETFHFSLAGSTLLFSKLYDYLSYYCSNHETKLFQCLANVTAEKMDKYFAAGNKHYKGGKINSPDDLFISA